ncbi:MAG: sugar transferase [Actinomycetota bacterium]|nr:sugar transferase [Actinomycetota bacterium]
MTASPHPRPLDEPTPLASDVRPAPPASESLVERYRRLADTEAERRPVDPVLRALDVGIAAGSLVLLSPLIAVLAVAVRAASGSPVLYRGPRVGRAGRVFTMYKFRTLRPDAEARLGPYLGPELTRRTEAELTPVGRVLRASQLDELPQLINVLRGEMAIVGPRPIRPAFFEELCRQIPQYWQRLVVRPGMTGFAQLRVTREMTWAEKLAHDLEYIADRSVSLYLRVVLATGGRVAAGFLRGLRSLRRRRG